MLWFEFTKIKKWYFYSPKNAKCSSKKKCVQFARQFVGSRSNPKHEIETEWIVSMRMLLSAFYAFFTVDFTNNQTDRREKKIPCQNWYKSESQQGNASELQLDIYRKWIYTQ